MQRLNLNAARATVNVNANSQSKLAYTGETNGKLDDKKLRPLKMQGRRSLLTNVGSRNNLRKQGVSQSTSGGLGLKNWNESGQQQTQASSSPNIGINMTNADSKHTLQ